MLLFTAFWNLGAGRTPVSLRSFDNCATWTPKRTVFSKGPDTLPSADGAWLIATCPETAIYMLLMPEPSTQLLSLAS